MKTPCYMYFAYEKCNLNTHEVVLNSQNNWICKKITMSYITRNDTNRKKTSEIYGNIILKHKINNTIIFFSLKIKLRETIFTINWITQLYSTVLKSNYLSTRTYCWYKYSVEAWDWHIKLHSFVVTVLKTNYEVQQSLK